MDADIAKAEGLSFLLLRRRRRGHKRKKNCKNPRFWIRNISVKARNMKNIATSAGTENWR